MSEPYTGRMTPRPTTYNGQMRSRLETRFAAYLDNAEIAWEYEPRAFANRHGQYLPDFAIRQTDGSTAYIEVKPTEQLGWLATTRMETIWDSEPNAPLLVVFPRGDDWSLVSARRGQGWASRACDNCSALALQRDDLERQVADLTAERDELRERLTSVESYAGNGRAERVGSILGRIGWPA